MDLSRLQEQSCSHQVCPMQPVYSEASNVFMSADSVCTAEVSINGIADASAERLVQNLLKSG